jgi:hypothetical protein
MNPMIVRPAASLLSVERRAGLPEQETRQMTTHSLISDAEGKIVLACHLEDSHHGGRCYDKPTDTWWYVDFRGGTGLHTEQGDG